jgi:hypothetical protein
MEKKGCVMLVFAKLRRILHQTKTYPLPTGRQLARVVTSFDLVRSLHITVYKFLTIAF